MERDFKEKELELLQDFKETAIKSCSFDFIRDGIETNPEGITKIVDTRVVSAKGC